MYVVKMHSLLCEILLCSIRSCFPKGMVSYWDGFPKEVPTEKKEVERAEDVGNRRMSEMYARGGC